MFKSINIVRGLSLVAIFFFISCATYYQSRIEFQRDFESGDLEAAKRFLEKHKKDGEEKSKDRLLYFLDRGVVEQMLGHYDTSNYYFEKAYIYSQDFKRNIGAELSSMVTNPMVRPYKGEDYEVVMIHYFKTINYIQLGKYDEALVEVRRINIRLNEQSDKYEGKRYRYKEDAFAHLLMGCIYEAKGDYNNAFIAYRNSYQTYLDVYREFNVDPPLQLKKDILRTAYLTGFYEEQRRFEEEFELKTEVPSDSSGSLVFFWLNGLVPVKGEFSINLYNTGGSGGAIVFADDQAGLSFPVLISNPDQQSSIQDLKAIRLALPKFNRRDPLFQSASLIVDDSSYPLQEVEDLNAIAIANLEDRLFKEIALSIGRLALKQAAEQAVREQNEGLGAAVSIINAATEKADTRNWQTLPNQIHYQRVFLKEGEQKVDLVTKMRPSGSTTNEFHFQIVAGRTTFHTYHSLASLTFN